MAEPGNGVFTLHMTDAYKTLTRQQVMDYFRNNTANPERDVFTETNRYIVWAKLVKVSPRQGRPYAPTSARAQSRTTS